MEIWQRQRKKQENRLFRVNDAEGRRIMLDTYYEDGGSCRGYGTLINHGKPSNVKFVWMNDNNIDRENVKFEIRDGGQMVVQAIKAIAQGDQLFANYFAGRASENYSLAFSNYQTSVRKKKPEVISLLDDI